jgi:hypothetical protein
MVIGYCTLGCYIQESAVLDIELGRPFGNDGRFVYHATLGLTTSKHVCCASSGASSGFLETTVKLGCTDLG